MTLKAILSKTVMRRACFRHLLAVGLCLLVALLVRPLRNGLLHFVLPPAWREVGSLDLFIIGRVQPPEDISVTLTCVTGMRRAILDQKEEYALVTQTTRTLDRIVRRLRPRHSAFTPGLQVEDHARLMHMYMVMSQALRAAKVEFFLRAGSLIGVHRHRGVVPWDDDMDVAVNGTHWRTARDELACIQGFTLHMTTSSTHWKLKLADREFPFIDIFLYAETRDYVFALTHYTWQFFLLHKSDVFPLTTGQFEGLTVPIPRHTDAILRRAYDVGQCVSKSLNHRTETRLTQVSIPCKELSYVYDIYNLD